jgi:hypothetical protein
MFRISIVFLSLSCPQTQHCLIILDDSFIVDKDIVPLLENGQCHQIKTSPYFVYYVRGQGKCGPTLTIGTQISK